MLPHPTATAGHRGSGRGVHGAVGAVKMLFGRRAACVLQRVPVRLFASEGTAMGSLLTCEEVAKLRNSMRGNIALLDTREPKVVKEKPFFGDDVCHWYARELSDKLPEEYEPNALDDAVPKMLFPKNKKVVVFSTHGFRSMIVCLHLKHHGWTDVCNMSGGSASYEEVVGQKPRQDTDGGRDDEYISDDEDNKRA